MKKLSIMMVILLLAACKTTESAKLEVVKEAPIEETSEVINPLADIEIPPMQIFSSTKPVMCGRVDSILNQVYEKYGEVPLFVGETEVTQPSNTKSMITLTFNDATGTFTFLETMPIEQRLFCVLSSGKARLKDNLKTESALTLN
jgi:hypothetical protein|tara:strand:+ start:902 stop:1336 length:435 start_codon:yes stop_codon:yes gene_type:complete